MRHPIRLVAIAFPILIAAAVDFAVAAEPAVERFRGRAVSTGTGRVAAGFITIEVSGWTNDQDTARYADLLVQSGQDEVVKAWQKEKVKVGYFRFAQTLGNDLRVARARPTETGGRHLFLISDRPIAGFEIRRGSRSEDYPISIIELILDATGKGSGKLFPAVELEAKDGTLVVKSLGHDAVDLSEVELSSK